MNRPKILIVDDEESVRLSGQYILDHEFSVTTAETTVKALELLEKEQFDLVLLDIMIKSEGPESGIDALAIIRMKYPRLPVVILSGTVSWMQKWDQLNRLGAVGFLGKPFETHKIREVVDRCLKGEKHVKIL